MNLFDQLEVAVGNISSLIWGKELIVFVFSIGMIASFLFDFAQIKYFFTGWRLIFAKSKEGGDSSQKSSEISPMQAFINSLSASIGNGGLAGMAIVLVEGGPGAVFWIFILGFFNMILRFFEVYAGLKFSENRFIGPVAYIRNMPIGKIISYFYGFVLFVYILCGGIAMQTNSIGLSIHKAFGVNNYVIGIGFVCLIAYIIFGGSERIMKASEYIIPVKVLLFFLGIIALLVYHRAMIVPSFWLIMDAAFNTKAALSGIGIFTMQKAIYSGVPKALNATEAGMGTASIFFSSSDSKNALKSSLMSMITAFISTNLVCSMLIFSIIVSGVSTDGLTSTALVIKAFSTILGGSAGSVVTFLSLSFGLGVMVAYIFLGYKVWQFLFGGRGLTLYYAMLMGVAFFGAVASVGLVWKSLDILAGSLLCVNLLALLWNAPKLRKEFLKDQKELDL